MRNKEKKLYHVQIRITETEKNLIDEMRRCGITPSSLFRQSLHNWHCEHKAKDLTE